MELVARTISCKLVQPNLIDPHLVLAALIAAIIWTVLCTRKGLPISVSHALIGAMTGAAWLKAGAMALIWKQIGIIVAFIFLSPLIGLLLA